MIGDDLVEEWLARASDAYLTVVLLAAPEEDVLVPAEMRMGTETESIWVKVGRVGYSSETSQVPAEERDCGREVLTPMSLEGSWEGGALLSHTG
jgi:hypothetical protein